MCTQGPVRQWVVPLLWLCSISWNVSCFTLASRRYNATWCRPVTVGALGLSTFNFPLESRHELTCLLTSVWCWCVRCVGLSRLYIYAGLLVPQSGRVVYTLRLIRFCCMGLVLIKPGINPSVCLYPFALVSTPCWCHHHESLNFLPFHLFLP